MDPNQASQKAQEQQKWAPLDSFSIVEAVREGLYQIPDGERSKIEAPLNEALQRLEVHSRAALGTTPFVGSGSGSSR